jgi:hypothetical protein
MARCTGRSGRHAQNRLDRKADSTTSAIWHAFPEEVDAFRGGLVHVPSLSCVHEGCDCPPGGLGMQCHIGRCGHEFVVARQLLRRVVSLVGRHDGKHLFRAAMPGPRVFVGSVGCGIHQLR